MARQQKNTVDYFPHYVKHRRTIYVLESRWGNDGYAFLFKLCEMLGEEDGHALDLSDPGEVHYLAARTKISEEVALEIIECLVTLKKLDRELWEQDRVVWYQGYVDKLCEAYRKRNRSLPIRPLLKNSEEGSKSVSATEMPAAPSVPVAEIPPELGFSARKCDKGKERKGKRSKTNQRQRRRGLR